MTARRGDRGGKWAWRLTGAITLCVYIFLFAPIVATIVLSFNASMFGGFPLTGFSLQWYAKLLTNEQVMTAFKTSLWIALVTAAVTTLLGVAVALALVRFQFSGKQAFGTLVILPALVPETILGVGLLVLIKAANQPRSIWLLLLGHILLALPYVVLIVQARMVGISRTYEEAALSLGAPRLASFREITFPLLVPAIVAGVLLAFTISFDNTSAGGQRPRHGDDLGHRRHSARRRAGPPGLHSVEETYASKRESNMKLSTTKRLELLSERHRDGNISRRTFLTLTAAAAASTGLSMPWMGRALAAVSEVRFDGWGGVVQEAIDKLAFQPYTAKSGVKVVQGTFGDENEIITKIKTSKPGDFQIIHSSGVNYYIKYVNGGYNSEINEANIPNMVNVLEAMIEPFRKITPKLSAVPYDYGTTGIAYNTKVISPEEAKEQGANLLADKKYAGKIGGYADMTTRVWYAALQTGQDPNAIRDMDAVWGKVRETRDLAKKFWSSGAELMDLLSKEEIVVTDAWSGRVAALQQQGAPIAYLDPAGSYAWMEDMLVLKGSPMAECEELINFMLDPATAIAVAEGQNYPPSLDPTKVKLTDKIAALPAFDPTGTMKSLTFADPVYWAENEDAWTKQWDRVSKGA
jgi:spermidine/putrescine transport system substrate-binding protein